MRESIISERDNFYYQLGFDAGVNFVMKKQGLESMSSVFMEKEQLGKFRPKKTKRNVKQSAKQKLLTQMTKKKWDRYKKGRGKKTYVEIRGEVSRSQAYKKAAKRL